MKTIISLITIILTLVISIFIFSNVLLTIFYTIPRISKERRQNNLIKKIPILRIIGAPIIFLIILALGIFLSYKYLPKHMTEIYIGLGLGIIMHLTRIGKKNSDMDEDFRRYFNGYLKNENSDTDLSNTGDENIDSDYYVSPTLLKNMEKRAFEKYIVKDLRSAIAIYDKILDLNPNIPSVLTMRAQCLENLNFNLDAIDDYETALKIDDSDGNIIGLMGLLYLKTGELIKAKHYLELSINKGWNTYEPNLKMIKSFSGDLLKAMSETLKKPENLLRRNKKDFEDDLSEIDRREFNENLIKTIEGVKRGLALDPDNLMLKELYNNFYSKLN